jgi:hypothetical protein
VGSQNLITKIGGLKTCFFFAFLENTEESYKNHENYTKENTIDWLFYNRNERWGEDNVTEREEIICEKRK